MGKMSKAAKAEAYDYLNDQNFVYRSLLHKLFNGDAPDAVERFTDRDGYECEFRLYASLAAHGGLIAVLNHNPRCEARSLVEAALFERWDSAVAELPFDGDPNSTTSMRKIAAERLRMARSRIYERERERTSDTTRP